MEFNDTQIREIFHNQTLWRKTKSFKFCSKNRQFFLIPLKREKSSFRFKWSRIRKENSWKLSKESKKKKKKIQLSNPVKNSTKEKRKNEKEKFRCVPNSIVAKDKNKRLTTTHVFRGNIEIICNGEEHFN